MFQRYTERARRVIYYARQEASQTGSAAIETEHMLLGLMRENVNLFHQIAAGKDVDAFRAELFGELLPLPTSTSIDLPLTPSAKRVLKHAEGEASALAHRHIETEHLLLGVLRESDSTAARMLQKYGLTREQVMETIPKGSLFDPANPHSPPSSRHELHTLLDELPDAALSLARGMLERLAAGQARLASPSQARSESVGWNFPALGHSSSASRTGAEDEAWINETHHKFAGQTVRVIQRFRLSDDQKTLKVSYEIRGPKGEHRGEAEFDIS